MLWRKLVTPTAVVSLLWLAVGGATVYYLDWVYRSHSRDLAENFTTIQAADAMQDTLWQLQATVIEVSERADSHTRIEVAALERAFEAHLADAAVGSATPEARALVAAIRGHFSEYQQHIHRRLDSKSPKGSDQAPPIELSRSAHSIAESCKSLLKIQEGVIADSMAQRGRLRVVFSRVMLTLWIVGPTVGIILGLWIANRLQRSISRISISLKDAAGGLDCEVGRVDLVPSDDLPALQQQVQRVSSRIKQVVDDLQEARRETMRADRLAAVGEMAAGIAHELRNPLTSVKLLMQTAADGPSGQTLTDEHIHVVLEQVIRMENAIQGLLDFARPPQMQKRHHDIGDTLRRALNLVEGYARQQGVALLQERSVAPLLVDGDPEQLHQVFVNLLLNGVEAMPDGGELRITVQRVDAATPVCRVLFCDIGTGISEAVMQRIFEPFVTSKDRGTGLGLAISRRIVEQHGGRLTATNREHRGAVFTVELPLSRNGAAQETALSRSTREDSQTAHGAESPQLQEAQDAQAARG
jgi:two-component system, NtrC family, sensor histidine kinase HydH